MRDDFTREVLDVLAKRVGVRCSNPACRKPTTGPRSDPGKIVNIGVGAHITAAAEGGPRYDPSLPREHRKSADNGIWLCQNCAKLVDNDPTHYTVYLLRRWKLEAEERARLAVERGGQLPDVEDAVELGIEYKKRRIESERHDYVLQVTVLNLGTQPLNTFHIDLEFPKRVLQSPEAYASFVPGRSSRETGFFRFTDEKPLYPGDTLVAMEVPYFVDQSTYESRGNLLELPVRTTLYRPDLPPLTVYKKFGEMQCF